MIGITLIKYLLKKNIEVLAIIRENSTRKEVLPKSNKIKVLECNIENLEKIDDIKEKYDIFFHFAWDGTFGKDRNNLYKQNLNVKYTLDAVNLAHKLGCTTFIGAGSQAEFGRVDGTINENTPTNPENGYGIAKFCAGNLSRMLAKQLGLKHIWTRIFSIYGPYDREHTMIMDSINLMLKGQSIEYTKAEQIWDYLYSEDLAEALYLLSKYGKDEQVYCIGNGNSRRLIEYINDIKKEVNSNIELKLGAIPYAKNQVMNLNVDISKLKQDTGFMPKTDFKDGIKKIIEWKRGKTKV